MDRPIQLGPDIKQLANALTDTPVSVWAQGPDLNYVWVFNPALGLSADEVVGMTEYDLHDPETAALVVDVKTRAMKSGREMRETVQLDRDGRRETREFHVRPVFDADNRPSGVTGVSMQVSDDRMTIAEEANHRIKNSLMLAQTLLRMQRRASDSADARETLREAEGQIGSIARFHGTLAEGGNGRVEIAKYLEKVCGDLAATMSQAKAVEIDHGFTPAIVDGPVALKFGLVLSELVTNAVKHGQGADGPIRVNASLETDGDAYRLSVSDSGGGVPSDFDPDSDGGLGMRILNTIARELGGEIRAEQRDGGACFVLVAPHG
jgi:PAS domain S-box-containing protein